MPPKKQIDPWIAVVALALFDGESRLLLQQRPLEKHHGGLWEFPGGKVERGETPQIALSREVEEELGLKIPPLALGPSYFEQEGNDPEIVLLLYIARESVDESFGEPVARDGQNWGWFSKEEAGKMPLAPMDRKFLSRMSD